MKTMTAKQFQRVDDTLDIMHKDIEDRFEDNAALLSLCVSADEDGNLQYGFRASGDAAVLAGGMGEALEEFPALIAIIQEAVHIGNSDAILTNFLSFLSEADPNDFDYDDDPNNPFGLD